MARIDLSTQEIQELASCLGNWARKLDELNRSIKSGVGNMSTAWKDPQYELFLSVITSTYKQIEMYIRQFQDMQLALKKYAEMQEAIRRDFYQHMDTYR